MPDIFLKSDAVFSPCGKYRYVLRRIWDEQPPVVFIGLNPSVADAEKDDPTIRRCVGFARDWGYGGLVMLNLFALRSTNPDELYDVGIDPVGPENDDYILTYAHDTIAAWGTHGSLLNRGEEVLWKLQLLGRKVLCLGKTAGGSPRHPLYLKKTTARVSIEKCERM